MIVFWLRLKLSERVQCRRCHQVWERFSYRGGVSAGGDGGGDGGPNF